VYAASRSCINRFDGNLREVQMDVTNIASIDIALDVILKQSGQLDALINNAGLGMAGPLECTTDAEAKEIFDTNLFGVLNVCRAAIPLLRMSKGKMINVTSIGGIFALPYRGIYSASKFAVEGISEALSMELANDGISVSIIEPGDFKTNINANRKGAAAINKDLYPKFEAVLEQINHEVSFAQDPILIAKTVHTIIESKKPRLRYRVATATQHLSVWLYRLLPGRWFEKLILKHYNLR
jgi:NAD(P)-dependent dehydrogenase (short-subunit alcohol dehydrogenase family)